MTVMTPEEEFALRSEAADLWAHTWGHEQAVEITSKKAFIEGNVLGLSLGIIAARAIHRMYQRKLLYQAIGGGLLLIAALSCITWMLFHK
jgi:hypothetical protein